MTARTRLGLVNTVSMEPATRIARSKAYLTRRLEKTLSRSLLSRVAVIKSQIFAGGLARFAVRQRETGLSVLSKREETREWERT